MMSALTVHLCTADVLTTGESSQNCRNIATASPFQHRVHVVAEKRAD